MSDLTHTGSSNNNSICVVLQPPLPTLQNRTSIEGSSSPTMTGNVPILLTPNLMNATANTLPVTNISNKSNMSTSVADSPVASDSVEYDSKPQDKSSTEQKSPVFSI